MGKHAADRSTLNAGWRTARAASAVCLGLAIFWPAQALAYGYDVRVTPLSPNLGTVIPAASGQTVFRINPSTGVVTRISGSGVRMSTGTTRALVTIKCDDDDDDWDDDDWDDWRDHDSGCGGLVNVKIGYGGSSIGHAGTLTNFTVAMGTAQLHSSPAGTNPISFQLKPIHKNDTVSFYVGMDFPVKGGEAVGILGYGASNFYVYARKHPGTPDSGDTGWAILKSSEPLSISSSSQLNFGTIVRPPSGSSVVKIDAATGARTITGLARGIAAPAPTAAAYLATGEDMQSLNITVPSTITMSGPGATLTVTTNNNLPINPVLNGSGQLNFKVGGSFTVTSSTKVGSYTGSFPVTVAYN